MCLLYVNCADTRVSSQAPWPEEPMFEETSSEARVKAATGSCNLKRPGLLHQVGGDGIGSLAQRVGDQAAASGGVTLVVASEGVAVTVTVTTAVGVGVAVATPVASVTTSAVPVAVAVAIAITVAAVSTSVAAIATSTVSVVVVVVVAALAVTNTTVQAGGRLSGRRCLGLGLAVNVQKKVDGLDASIVSGSRLLVGLDGGVQVLLVLQDLGHDIIKLLNGRDVGGGVLVGLDVGLLHGKAATEGTGRSRVEAADSADIAGGGWRKRISTIQQDRYTRVPDDGADGVFTYHQRSQSHWEAGP